MSEKQKFRIYGQPPVIAATVHGGPGAAGEMAVVAGELARAHGVLEPLQTEHSVSGQIKELKKILISQAELPVILIGFSWGAWLCYMLSARHPDLIRKLILISSAPFKDHYAANILNTRLNRLIEEENIQAETIMHRMNLPCASDKNALFSQFGAMISRADAFDPIEMESEGMIYDLDIFQKVWPEAALLRSSGELLEMGRRIRCPVVAIHGDYDPHPAEGVREPLSRVIRDFRFILLEKCGHRPWMERHAKEKFYKILKEEIIQLKPCQNAES